LDTQRRHGSDTGQPSIGNPEKTNKQTAKQKKKKEIGKECGSARIKPVKRMLAPFQNSKELIRQQQALNSQELKNNTSKPQGPRTAGEGNEERGGVSVIRLNPREG
jgi:hypothetical protein